MTDKRPEVLVELGTELERAATRTLSKTTRADDTRQGFLRRRSALSLTAIAAAGALAFTLAFTGHRHLAGRDRSMPSGTLALDTAFVVLRRPAEPDDGLASSELRFLRKYSHAFHVFSLEPARSRRVVTTANLMVWLVPGPRDVCLVGVVGRPIAQGGRGASFPVGCDSASVAERYGMIGTFGDTVAGVLPNRSTHVEAIGRDGHTTDLELTEGAFAFPYRRQDLPLNVDYIDPTGARQQFQVSSSARASH